MPHAEVIRLPVQPPKLANPDGLQPAELRAELRRANDLLMDMTLQLAALQNALCNSVRHVSRMAAARVNGDNERVLALLDDVITECARLQQPLQ